MTNQKERERVDVDLRRVQNLENLILELVKLNLL